MGLLPLPLYLLMMTIKKKQTKKPAKRKIIMNYCIAAVLMCLVALINYWGYQVYGLDFIMSKGWVVFL